MKQSLLFLFFIYSIGVFAVDPLSIKSCKVLEKEMKDTTQKMLKIKDNIFELASDPVKLKKSEAEMQVLVVKSATLKSKKEQLKCKFTLEVDANNIVKVVQETKEKREAEEKEKLRKIVYHLCTCCGDYCESFAPGDVFRLWGDDACSKNGCTYKHYASTFDEYDTNYGETLFVDFCNKNVCKDTKSLSDDEIKTIHDDFYNKYKEVRDKAIYASFSKYYKDKLRGLKCTKKEKKASVLGKLITGDSESSDGEKRYVYDCPINIDSMSYDELLKEYGKYSKDVLNKRYPNGLIPKDEKTNLKISELTDGQAIYHYEHLK